MWILIAVIAVIFSAGCFGGLINYFLARSDEADDATVVRSVTIGVGASFMVPLFLNMISSNLIDSITGKGDEPGDKTKLLVLAGFCLIAAISSRAFIQTISDRILSELRAAKKQAEEAKADAAIAKNEVAEVQATVDPLIDKGTEPELVVEIGHPSLTAEISDDQIKTVQAFARSRYAHRSLRGLSIDTGISEIELESLLEDLAAKRLVGKRESKAGYRWFMTDKGLELAVRPGD